MTFDAGHAPSFRFSSTFTGVFDFTKAFQGDLTQYRLLDIAWALSGILRWAGHTRCGLPVSLHCIVGSRVARTAAVAYGASEDAARYVAAEMLIHDGEEAYTSDVPGPFKAFVPQFRDRADELRAFMFRALLPPISDEVAQEVQVLRRHRLDELLCDAEHSIGFRHRRQPEGYEVEPGRGVLAGKVDELLELCHTNGVFDRVKVCTFFLMAAQSFGVRPGVGWRWAMKEGDGFSSTIDPTGFLVETNGPG